MGPKSSLWNDDIEQGLFFFRAFLIGCGMISSDELTGYVKAPEQIAGEEIQARQFQV